ncbi:MAG TPA: epoxyqueuosine reductase [Nitrospinota bacterium]|nr:epoxyqueuosine reductase [Nitrospinota bacterium]
MEKRRINKGSILEGLIKQSVYEIAGRNQEYIYGFSYVKDYVPSNAKGLDYCITIGLKLDDEIIDSISDGPTRKYLEHYRDVNQKLREISDKIRNSIEESLGCRAVAFPPSTPDEVKKTSKFQKELSSDFSHKIGATRSGLGWIGKTALLVSKRFGPRLRLVSVLTDYKLKVGTPLEKSLCNNCTICIENCPAMAGSDIDWKPKMKREEFFDAFRCMETCRELTKERIGETELICGICVSLCPQGRSKECSYNR